MNTLQLLTEWDARAAIFRDHKEERLARTYEKVSEELKAALQEEQNTLLNLHEAATISGYSPDHLGRLVREKKIPNFGRNGAPRIRRKDLPIKNLKDLRTSEESHILPSMKEQIVRSVVGR
jgi:hypothetical protein